MLGYPVSVKAQLDVSAEDSLALVALYNATSGPNWTNNTNWLTGPVDTWFGITVVGSRVREVNIQGNNLHGVLPSELGDLTELRRIYFVGNNLTGSIPPELGDLTKLEHLHMEINDLTGSIPSTFGNLSRLETLFIYGNQLQGAIPPQLGALPRIITISLRSNQLTGMIPASLGNLTTLSTLSLSNNRLSGSIPASLGNLNALVHLSLGSNMLSGPLPSELGHLTNLTSLQLQENQLEGTIPASWGGLSKLETLYLFNNNLEGVIPPEIEGMIALKTLLISDNQFSGSLPDEIGNLTNLIDFRARNNQFSGHLPPSLNNMAQLKLIYIDDNAFEGELPIGSLRNLTEVRFSNNKIEDLPSLHAARDLFYVNALNNKLTFEDIEPNIGLPEAGFNYAPQAYVGEAEEYTIESGETLALHIPVGGDTNIYYWYRDGMPLVGEDTDTYTITRATHIDTGSYILYIGNAVATGLILRSHRIQVNVITYPPETQADVVATLEDMPVDIDVLGNDMDPEGSALSVKAFSPSQFGTTALNPDGTIRYAPAANFHGTDTFIYTAGDDEGKTAQGHVTITVTPVNDAPYFTSEPEEMVTEGQVYAYTVTTTDVDADILTLDAMTLPAWLTLTDNNNTSALLTGTPMQADVGTHPVVLEVTDGTEIIQQAFDLTVTDVNIPPPPPTLTALMDGSSVVLEGDPEAPFVVTWTASVDPDGDPLTYRWELAMENTFASLLFSEDVDTATRFETTVGAIGALLRDAGVEIQTSITLFHRVVTSDGVNDIASDPAQITLTRGIITDTEISSGLPEQFTLLGNYPNPFNPETTIRVDMPEAAQVTVVLYDVLGREARRVEAGALSAGTGQTIRISAGDLSSGVYVYRVIGRLASGEVKTATGQMTLLK